MIPVGRFGLYALLAALPVAVDIPTDSTEAGRGTTRVTAIGGMGTLALIDRGCEGQVIDTHPYDFREAAGAIEHEFPSGLAVGVRGGSMKHSSKPVTIHGWDVSTYPARETTYVSQFEFSNEYIQPTIAYEHTSFGVGAGWIWSRQPFINQTGPPEDPGPSFHLRLGRRDGTRFELSYMENLPLYSGGGYFEFGLGIHPHRLLDFSVSLNNSLVYSPFVYSTGLTPMLGPFDGLGVGLEVDYRVQPHWSLLGRARLGNSGGESQTGVALGLSYSTRPPLPVHRSAKTAKIREGDTDADGWNSRLDPKGPPKPPAPAAPAPAPEIAVPAPAVIPLTDDGRYPRYGEYQVLDSLAVPLSRVDPIAPDTTTGTVSVAVLVSRTGQVVETRVIKSVPGLDAAAVACVRQWTFRPAIDRKVGVASWVTIPVRFGPR